MKMHKHVSNLVGLPLSRLLERTAAEKPSSFLFDLEFYGRNADAELKKCVVFLCKSNSKHQFEILKITYSKTIVQILQSESSPGLKSSKYQALPEMSFTLKDNERIELLRSMIQGFLKLYRSKSLVAAMPKLHSHCTHSPL